MSESICSFDPSSDNDSYNGNNGSNGNDDNGDDDDNDDTGQGGSPGNKRRRTGHRDGSSGQGGGGSNTAMSLHLFQQSFIVATLWFGHARFVLLNRSSTTSTTEESDAKTQQDQTASGRSIPSVSQKDELLEALSGQPSYEKEVEPIPIVADEAPSPPSTERHVTSSESDEFGLLFEPVELGVVFELGEDFPSLSFSDDETEKDDKATATTSSSDSDNRAIDKTDQGTTTKVQQLGVDAMDEPAEVIERVVKDGNGKEGKYTGTCRIVKNESTGRCSYVPIGRGRMEYANNSVYDGEWKDDRWAGDGSFTHHSGWTVEGQWEKDRCTECSSVSGLTDANCESAYEWSQQQDAAVVIPPIVEAIEGLGVDMSQFFEGQKRQAALHVASKGRRHE